MANFSHFPSILKTTRATAPTRLTSAFPYQQHAARSHELRGAVHRALTKYPTISDLWRRHWEQITPMFAFPPEIRKIIYTTNAVESLHRSLRKVIKTHGSFPSEEAAQAAVLGFAQRLETMGPVAELEAGPQPFRPFVGSALPTKGFIGHKRKC